MKYMFSNVRPDLYRYVRFLFGGGLSLMLNLGITYLLTEFLQFWHMTAFAIALGCEILFLFTYHSFITFRKQCRFFLFAGVVLFISGLNWLAVYSLTEILSLQYLLAILLAATVISVVNYTLNRNVVFK